MTSPFDKGTRGGSEAARRKCLAYWGLTNALGRLVMVCQGCGCMIEAIRAKTWDADHRIPVALGGQDEAPNIRPLCCACHDRKTAGEDIPRIAKGKAQRDKHFGVKRSTGFRRPKGMTFDWKTGRYRKTEE